MDFGYAHLFVDDSALPKQFIVISELPKMGRGKIDFRAATALVIEMLHAKNI